MDPHQSHRDNLLRREIQIKLIFQFQDDLIKYTSILTLNIGSDSSMSMMAGASKFSGGLSSAISATFIFRAPPEFSRAICSTTVRAWFFALSVSSSELFYNTKII